MGRRVITGNSVRCERCRLPPRWCICPGLRTTACALEIDVLMHHREVWRPSSTGHVINRTFPASRQHLWRRERGLTPAEVRVPGRELWLLHPNGEPLPTDVPPAQVQVMLIDGAWREATAMVQEIAGWGRTVSLPMAGAGESRYWLRAQSDAVRFSTAEALIFLLGALGQTEAQLTLRLQFELHVYAGLRARGSKVAAEEFLAGSPVRAAFPELIAQLEVPRPREEIRREESSGGATDASS